MHTHEIYLQQQLLRCLAELFLSKCRLSNHTSFVFVSFSVDPRQLAIYLLLQLLLLQVLLLQVLLLQLLLLQVLQSLLQQLQQYQLRCCCSW